LKLVFLDIDGVFNSTAWYKKRSKSFDLKDEKEFDPNCVKIFNTLIEKVNPKIVVSSSWRTGKLSYLIDLFNMVGIKGEIIGETPQLRGKNFTNVPRGCEIKEYLSKRNFPILFKYAEEMGITTDIENYVIIDDDSDMLYEQRNNFVHTSVETGITEKDVELALKILT